MLGGCGAFPERNSVAACELRAGGSAAVAMLENVPIVVGSVDGHPLRLVLDTGSDTTFLSEAAARQLGLHLDLTRTRREQGIGGMTLNYTVVADTFRIADVTLSDQPFSIGTVTWRLAGDPPDGFLGSDVLSRFDIDLDLPDGRVSFYRARPCADATPPWDAPYDVALLEPSPAGTGLYGIPMRLDGQQVTGTLDSGAEYTTVAMSTARALGVTLAELDRDRSFSVFGFGPNLQTSRVHVFREISVGGDTWHNVPLIVADLPPLSGDLLLGSDFLRQHRVYLSYATGRIFISRAQFARGAMASVAIHR